MTTFLEFRAVVLTVNGNCGDLNKRYDPADARTLGKTLVGCMQILSDSLSDGTYNQGLARDEIYCLCLLLDAAIRHALAYPNRNEHQDAVVETVRELDGALYIHRRLFGLSTPWPVSARSGRSMPG